MTPFTDRAGRFSRLKTLTLGGLLVPALWLAYRALARDLGPLPVKEAMLFCGLWAVRFLILALALTPLQRIFRLTRLALIRRMVGLSAFFYALAHLVLYVATLKFDLLSAAREIVLRYYLAIGFVALLGLAALAATSTDGMVRRLGRRWRLLHASVYGIAVLALLHFHMQSKIDASQATLMAGAFILLMLYRFAIRLGRPLAPALLLALAALASVLTAATEFAWYATWTGVDPWKVLQANLTLSLGRPALWVFTAGALIALLAAVTSWRPVLTPRSGPAVSS